MYNKTITLPSLQYSLKDKLDKINNNKNSIEQNSISNHNSKIILNIEEPIFRRINSYKNKKTSSNKNNLKLNFLNTINQERNYKGILSNVFPKKKNKPIGILITNSLSNSYNNSSLIKSNISNRPFSSSFHHKRDLSFPLSLSEEVNIKRNKTIRNGTLNTFISTSETDKAQDTIESTFQYSPERNKKRFLKKQLSNISENPKNINLSDIINCNLCNVNNINNTLDYNKDFGSFENENLRKKRNSFIINNVVLNKTLKIRLNSAFIHKKNSYKNLIDLKKIFNNKNYYYYDSCSSDNQRSEKHLKLKEICNDLIEKNILREQLILNQKKKFISFFEIDKDKNIFNKAEKYKSSMINLCTNKIEKFLKNIHQDKKFGKINYKKLKKEILINVKERKILTNVTKYYFCKSIKKNFHKVITNIVHLKYAYKLSRDNFKINLTPKNISYKLENGFNINIFENFKLDNIDYKIYTPIKLDSSKKKNLNHLNIVRLTLTSLKFINNFLLNDRLIEKKKFLLNIQLIFRKFMLIKNKTRKEKQKKQTNKVSIIEKHKTINFPKEFFKREKIIQNIEKRDKKKHSSIFKIPNSITLDMKKNNVYKKNESLINNKDHIVLRTREIKSQIESKLKNELEKLVYYIHELNFYEFKLMFEKYSISPNLIDKHGNTLLSLSVQSNCFQITNYLLNSGADPNISNVNFFFLIFLE